MGDRHFLSAREIGFVSQKRRGRLSAFLFWRLSKAHTWTASVLVDELDPAAAALHLPILNVTVTSAISALRKHERSSEIGDIVGVLEAWKVSQVAQVRRVHLRRKSKMEWFSQKTTIAGSQISNWILALAALTAIFVIYSFLR